MTIRVEQFAECDTPWPACSVPATAVRNVIAAATPRVPAERMCGAIGLDPQALRSAQARLPFMTLAAAFEAGARLSGDRAFGLHVGTRVRARSFGLLGYLVMHSATVGEAFERLAHYFPLWTDAARFRFETDGSSMHLIWEYRDPSVAECRHDCEMTLASVATVGELLYGAGYCHREVHFQHAAPGDRSEHRRLFRAPVAFGQSANQLIFQRTIRGAAATGADPDLLELLIQLGDLCLTRITQPLTVVDGARVAVRRAIRSHDVGLRVVARTLGLEPRALQRRLRQRGTSYHTLLGVIRRELAEQYLRDPQMTISEISDRLVFAQPGQFQRAFRSWTGMTPGQFRRGQSAL